MAPLRRCALLAAVAAVSCVESYEVSLPPDLGGQSVLLVAARTDQPSFSVFAFERTPETTPSVPFVVQGPTEVHVLEYDEPLLSLGLPPGRIEAVTFGARVPDPSWVHSAKLNAGEQPTWQTQTGLPQRVEELRIKVPNYVDPDCARLEVVKKSRAPGSGRVLLEMPDDTALLAGIDPTLFYSVDDTGTVTELWHGNAAAAFVAEDDQLWFIDSSGHLTRGSLDVRVAVDTSTHPNGEFKWMVGRGTPPEIFVVTQQHRGGQPGGRSRLKGSFIRFLGSEAHILFEWEEDYERPIGGLAIDSDGNVIAVGHDERAVLVYDGAVAVAEQTPLLDDEIAVLTEIAGAVVIATEQGQVYARREGDWGLLADALPFGATFRALIPFRTGFLGFGKDALVVQYTDRMGLCPDVFSVEDVIDFARAIPFHGGFLAASRTGWVVYGKPVEP